MRRNRPTDVVLLKDLAPRKDVRGGRGKRLFGEQDEEAAMATKKKATKVKIRDLAPNKQIKGGRVDRISSNHNEVFIR